MAGLVSLQVPPEVLGASFLGPVLAGILSGAAEEGLEIQHVVERDADRPVAEVLERLVAEDHADGLILLTFLPLAPEDVAPLDRAGVPYVLVNRHFGARAVNCVTFQWEAAARDAALRLGRDGHRRSGAAAAGSGEHQRGRARRGLAGRRQGAGAGRSGTRRSCATTAAPGCRKRCSPAAAPWPSAC